MVYEFICWCNENQGFGSLLLSTITIFISLFVMWKSNKNQKEISEKQIQTQRYLASREERIQQYHLKVNTYIYKIDCYKSIYTLKEYMQLLNRLFETVDLSNKDFDNISNRYSKIGSNYNDIMMHLEQTQFVFQKNIKSDINNIKNNYKTLNNIFAKFYMYSLIFTNDEQRAKQIEKEKDINRLKDLSYCILRDIEKILPLLSENIRISL